MNPDLFLPPKLCRIREQAPCSASIGRKRQKSLLCETVAPPGERSDTYPEHTRCETPGFLALRESSFCGQAQNSAPHVFRAARVRFITTKNVCVKRTEMYVLYYGCVGRAARGIPKTVAVAQLCLPKREKWRTSIRRLHTSTPAKPPGVVLSFSVLCYTRKRAAQQKNMH